LEIHAWQERYGAGQSSLWSPIRRSNWKESFDAFVDSVRGTNVYVTIDLDCLALGESQTHWENGLFSAEDVAWAVGRLRAATQLVGGDLCGAWSEPAFARWTQKFASGFDHPKVFVGRDPIAARISCAHRCHPVRAPGPWSITPRRTRLSTTAACS
jgi:hypothetical protein